MRSPYAAYFRVYEPLAAFDDERAVFWREYVESGAVIDAADGPRKQRELFFSAMGIGWDKLPSLPEHAYVMNVGAGPLICPWQMTHRIAAAVRELPDEFPPNVISAFVSPSLLSEADQWGRGPDTRGRPGGPLEWHEHSAGWHIPVKWFVCVDESEREVVRSRHDVRVRYRVPMARARRRADQAYGILKNSLGGGNPAAASIRQQFEWLLAFHPRAMVELDFGGLAQVLSSVQLLEDDSPMLVADGLKALSRGDATEAGERYEELTRRWRQVRMGERGN